MQMRDRTKAMFAEELEAMLQEMPLSKVRVSRLCERCGATTPTFYYYFHDKYELVAWVYLRDFSLATGDSVKGYSPGVLEEVNARLEARKPFYQACFSDRSQNNIEEYALEFNLRLADDAVLHATGSRMTRDQLNAVRYHNYAILGMFRDWLYDRGDMTSAEMSEFLFERTPGFLKEAYGAYPYSAESILAQTGKETTRRVKAGSLPRK